MRRNCNLELALFPSYSSHHHNNNNNPIMEASSGSSKIEHLHQQQQQQCQQKEHHDTITIFYDGKICVSDVTELQARSILMLANKKMEERMKTPSGLEPSTPTVVESHQPLYSPATPLSMKRSLQRFLQKRKIRKQEASPYNHH
ncbi:PREDICTED: protein TIFY 5A [Lupinus angustifolius]|uniref:protein TIFY 5A n=1 Tax=Lupinus angustifolius TaxID=3871 RepID=UPI00092EF90F|nr:PREDICTED: protein TIFY 5A [Lupinus angustifolius]